MAAYFRGVPLANAIIVRHTPNDHRGSGYGKNKGAVPVGMAATANRYVGRYGDYRDKGDIDRSPTRSDEALMERAAAREGAEARSVEYISRTGAFSEKGRGRQVDASLWDQRGPVDVAQATRSMREAGGAFVDSLITVKREHAAELGLQTKEDMQRLVRATWSRAVEQWGAIRDPADIRWVAAYHTDADRSLHVHIHTWSARGEIEPGYTVPREATRRAKAVVYEVGYAGIRQERNARAAFLRDLSIVEARRQIGLEAEPARERTLNARAARAGWPERAGGAPDLDPAAAEKVASLRERLSAEVAEGRGRIARNYRAQATARDILSAVESGSPSFAAIGAEYASLAEAKAALRGYAEGTRQFDDFVRAELEDRMHRLEVDVVRGHVPGGMRSSRPLPEHLRHLDARGRDGWSNASFSSKLAGRAPDGREAVRLPGTQVRVIIPPREVAEINGGRARLAAIEDARTYEAVGRGGERIPGIAGRDVLGRLGAADMDLVAGSNYVPGTRERDAAREAGRRLAGRGGADDVPNRFSVRHGMPLGASKRLSRDVRALAAEASRTGAAGYAELSPEGRERADRVASALVDGSRLVRDALERGAQSYSARTGRGVAGCHAELRGLAVAEVRESVARDAAEATRGMGDAAGGRDAALGALDAAAGLAEAIAEIGGSEAAGSGRRGSKRAARSVERDLGRDVLRDVGRSRG